MASPVGDFLDAALAVLAPASLCSGRRSLGLQLQIGYVSAGTLLSIWGEGFAGLLLRRCGGGCWSCGWWVVGSGSRFPQRRSSAAASSGARAGVLGARPQPKGFSALASSTAAHFQNARSLGLPLFRRKVAMAGTGDLWRWGFLEFMASKGFRDLHVIFFFLEPFV